MAGMWVNVEAYGADLCGAFMLSGFKHLSDWHNKLHRVELKALGLHMFVQVGWQWDYVCVCETLKENESLRERF